MAKGPAESNSGLPSGMKPLGSVTIPGKPGRAQEPSSTSQGGASLPSPKGMVPLGTVRVPAAPNRRPGLAGASEDDGDGDKDVRG